jgi:hypothetical protein
VGEVAFVWERVRGTNDEEVDLTAVVWRVEVMGGFDPAAHAVAVVGCSDDARGVVVVGEGRDDDEERKDREG